MKEGRFVMVLDAEQSNLGRDRTGRMVTGTQNCVAI